MTHDIPERDLGCKLVDYTSPSLWRSLQEDILSRGAKCKETYGLVKIFSRYVALPIVPNCRKIG